MITKDFAQDLCREYKRKGSSLDDEDIILNVFKMVENTPKLLSEYKNILDACGSLYKLNPIIAKTVREFFDLKTGPNSTALKGCTLIKSFHKLYK